MVTTSQGTAAIFLGVGQPLVLQTHPIVDLSEGDVLVRVRCTTICGSDLHSFSGRRHCHLPAVLGHEIVGEICDWGGSAVCDYFGQTLPVGQRVTWSMLWTCGTCQNCQRGYRAACPDIWKFGHGGKSDWFPFTGGLAEYCILPRGTNIFQVPLGIEDRVVCPANCAGATIAAMMRRAGNLSGKRILICGAGMLGLMAAAWARWDGAGQIVVVDVDPRRRDLAIRFGADSVWENLQFTGDDVDPVARSSSRFDLLFEVTGSSDLMSRGLMLLDVGGQAIWAGAVFPGEPVPVVAETLVRRMLTVTGVYNYEASDLGNALEFLRHTALQFPWGTLVSPMYRLTDVNEAFRVALAQDYVRVAIGPAGNSVEFVG